jgi:hypothetical protein
MAPYPAGVTRLKFWGGGAHWRPESLHFIDKDLETASRVCRDKHHDKIPDCFPN